MMPECPDELARWLVAQGADVGARSKYQRTALHERAYFPQYSLQVLIELGCDVHAKCDSGTPLHVAAERCNADGVRLLLQAGAEVNEKNSHGNTPLDHALERCQNIHIAGMLATLQLLLEAGAKQSDKTKPFVEKIGKTFEWNRGVFNPKYLDATDAALQQLYKLFDATPAPQRLKYDGHSPIVAKSERWEDAHQELWELLVPASGPASTVQGEAIRISGKINRELLTNGSGNWNREYRKMANHFLKLVASGESLSDEQLRGCQVLISELPEPDDVEYLCEMSVAWVQFNPQPVQLGSVEYKV